MRRTKSIACASPNLRRRSVSIANKLVRFRWHSNCPLVGYLFQRCSAVQTGGRSGGIAGGPWLVMLRRNLFSEEDDMPFASEADAVPVELWVTRLQYP